MSMDQESANYSQTHHEVSKEDFETLSVIGKGTFGKVYLVRKQTGDDIGQLYAIKRIKKSVLSKRNMLQNTLSEISILQQMSNQHAVKIHYAFWSDEDLYMVLDYCAGGELFFYLDKVGRFAEETTRFYAANVVLALSSLHE